MMGAPTRGVVRDGQRKRRARGPTPNDPPPHGHVGADVDFHRAFNHLCHVLSLSRTGKPKAALDSMVITACVLAGGRVNGTGGVAEALQVFFGLPVPAQDLAASIERLQAGGRLLTTRAGGTLQVAPAAQAEVEDRTAAGDNLERIVRQEWFESLADAGFEVGTDADALWQCLRHYMARVFQQHGVLSVELLTSGSAAVTTDVASLDAALEAGLAERPCSDQDVARRAIQSFFETRTPARTKYLAQLLDNTFTFYAVAIHEAAALYMQANLPSLTLFLDTNFIFGLLGLHNNSLGAGAKELINFIRENQFPFKLYFHEQTLREIERTVSGIGRRLLGRRWPQEISRAAISEKRVLGALSGVEYRYHQLNSVQHVDPKDFLSKYNHVEQLLKEYGIKLYREPFNTPVVPVLERAQLIAEYKVFVEERRPKDPKPYEALDHDICVWLAVQEKRVPGRTPVDGGVLFVTLDLLFQDFDRRYLRSYNQAPGSVAVPNQLLQVLRPFGRQSADFDARFVETFGISEIRTAHSDYNDTISKVLSLLASFSDVPERTAVRILTDEVLLEDLSDLDEGSDEFRGRIDNALIAENAQLLEEQEGWRHERESEAEAHACLVAAKDSEIDALRSQVSAALAEAEQPGSVSNDVSEESHAIPDGTQRQQPIDAREPADALDPASKRVERAERLARIAVAALVAVVAAVVIGVVPWAAHWVWLERSGHRVGLYLSAVAVSVIACWAIAEPNAHRRGKAIVAAGVVATIILQLV